jgi:hypothetical protein
MAKKVARLVDNWFFYNSSSSWFAVASNSVVNTHGYLMMDDDNKDTSISNNPSLQMPSMVKVWLPQQKKKMETKPSK